MELDFCWSYQLHSSHYFQKKRLGFSVLQPGALKNLKAAKDLCYSYYYYHLSKNKVQYFLHRKSTSAVQHPKTMCSQGGGGAKHTYVRYFSDMKELRTIESKLGELCCKFYVMLRARKEVLMISNLLKNERLRCAIALGSVRYVCTVNY